MSNVSTPHVSSGDEDQFSSSASAANVVQIILCTAHSGSEFEFSVRTSDTVSSFQMTIASHVDVPIHDQILLSEHGTRFYSRMLIESYPYLTSPAGTDKPVVFLFNRQHLKGHNTSTPPPRLYDSMMDVNLPTIVQSSSINHPLQKSTSIMVRNLPDYLHDFDLHVQQAQAFIEAANARVRGCYDVLFAQRMQIRALEAAGRNLVGHKSHVETTMNDFLGTYEQRNKEYLILLDGFEKDVAELRNVELHPTLKTSERTTLLDCVKEGKLRAWAKVCRQDQDKLNKMVQKLQSTFDSLETSIDATLTPNPATNDLNSLESDLKETSGLLEEQQSILQTLIKDHGDVDELVNRLVDNMRESVDTQADVLDACTAFLEQANVHQQRLIPRLRDIDEQLKVLLQRFLDTQTRTQRNMFFKRLKTISEVQRDMRSVVGRTTAYAAVLTRLDEYFAQLKAVRAMPRAYKATVAEISRRNAYHKLIETQAETFQRLMQSSREEETQRRDTFYQEHGQYMPNTLIDGLGDRPVYVRLHVKNATSSLPQIRSDNNDNALLEPPPSMSMAARGAYDSPQLTQQQQQPVVSSAAGAESATAGSVGTGVATGVNVTAPLVVADSVAQDGANPVSAADPVEAMRMLELENEYLKAELALMNFDMASSIIPSLSQMKSLTATQSMLESRADRSNLNRHVSGDSGRQGQRSTPSDILTQFIRRMMEVDRPNQALYKSILPMLQQQQQPSSGAPSPAASNIVVSGAQEKIDALTQKLAKTQKQLQASKSKNATLKRQVNECQVNSADLENRLHETQIELENVANLRSENEKLNSELRNANEELDDMMRRTAKLLNENAQLTDSREIWKEIGSMKIAYSTFQINDVALFHRNEKGHYEAFNNGLPNRYLAEESVQSIREENRIGEFVLGKILYINSYTAGSEPPQNQNPYNLPLDTRYWTLTAELLM